MAHELITHVTDSSFQTEVIESELPVLIDFWAEWCVPCRAIGPVLDKMAPEYKGRLRICKVDVDHNQQIAMNYGIRSIPTLLLFKGGKVIDQRVGALNQRKMEQFVSKAL